MVNKAYCIYGASGHSKVIIEILERSGSIIKGLYDDANKKSLFNYSVSNQISMLELQNVNWIIGIGNNAIRKKIADQNTLNFGIAIDKSSNISKRAQIGRGSVVMPGVSINSSVIIGEHTIINTNSSIDHDCIIGDYTHISPNATLCGSVNVGKGTHIGAGAVIIPGIKIGSWTNIGAGSVIIRDVPDFVTVVGNPGRLIKQHRK